MVFPWVFYGLAPVEFRTLKLIIFCLIHLLLVHVAAASAVDSHMLQPVFQNSIYRFSCNLLRTSLRTSIYHP